MKKHRLARWILAMTAVVCMFPARSFTALVNAADTHENGVRTVSVKVTATPAEGGEDVTVPGATVNVYHGQGRNGEAVDRIASFETGEDGIAACTITIPGEYAEKEDKTEEYLSGLTFSAVKKVANSDGLDHADPAERHNRDKLFRVYREGADNRLQLELHSESIDANGNWVGEKLPLGNESEINDNRNQRILRKWHI